MKTFQTLPEILIKLLRRLVSVLSAHTTNLLICEAERIDLTQYLYLQYKKNMTTKTRHRSAHVSCGELFTIVYLCIEGFRLPNFSQIMLTRSCSDVHGVLTSPRPHYEYRGKVRTSFRESGPFCSKRHTYCCSRRRAIKRHYSGAGRTDWPEYTVTSARLETFPPSDKSILTRAPWRFLSYRVTRFHLDRRETRRHWNARGDVLLLYVARSANYSELGARESRTKTSYAAYDKIEMKRFPDTDPGYRFCSAI